MVGSPRLSYGGVGDLMECRYSRPPMPAATTTPSRNPLFTLLVSLSLVLVLLVAGLSAYIRLAGVGLGCADWPACYGQVAAGADTLAVKLAPPTWAGLTHRIVASLLGLLILGLALGALRRRRQPGQPVAIPLVLLGVTVFLSVLGYATPSPLVPWVTLANLLGGFGMLALLWWLSQRGAAPVAVDAATTRMRPWAAAGLVLVLLQIALGGWVSANYAALACTTLPGCDAAAWSWPGLAQAFDPARTLELSAAGVVANGAGAALIHLVHRLGAFVTLIYIGMLGLRSAARGGRLKATGFATLVLLASQAGLGALIVVTGLPLIAVTAHNLVAALLLLSVVNLNHLLYPKAPES